MTYEFQFSIDQIEYMSDKIYNILMYIKPYYVKAMDQTGMSPKIYFERAIINEIANNESELFSLLDDLYMDMNASTDDDMSESDAFLIRKQVSNIFDRFNIYKGITNEYNKFLSERNIADSLYKLLRIIISRTDGLMKKYIKFPVSQEKLNSIQVLENNDRYSINSEGSVVRPNGQNRNNNRNSINTRYNIGNNGNNLEYGYGEANEYNNQNNRNNNVNSLGSQLPKNALFNTLNTVNTSKYNGLKTDKCVDPLLFTNENIGSHSESTQLYIADAKKKIVKVFCLDDDAYKHYFESKDNLFFRCKPTVPEGALFIKADDVLTTRIRRLPFDIICYVYENQVSRLRKGGKYILTPGSTAVGRIASYNVLRGESVVSAEHCQNNYVKDFIYGISEYRVTEGGRRRRSTMNGTKKHTIGKRKTMKRSIMKRSTMKRSTMKRSIMKRSTMKRVSKK
jgi:hypothetical protein